MNATAAIIRIHTAGYHNMEMKLFYIGAIQAAPDGRKYAVMITLTKACNLAEALEGSVKAHIFETKRECRETVKKWNDYLKTL